MGKGWLRIVAGAVIGLLVGLGVRAYLQRPPLFPRWEELPPTASVVTELGIGPGCGGTAYVRMADGSSMQLSQTGPQRWLPSSYRGRFYPLTEFPQPCGSSPSKKCFNLGIGPCDLSSEAFSTASHPPADITACLQSRDAFAEMLVVQDYVFDSRGALWRWYWVPSCSNMDIGRREKVGMLSTSAMFFCPILGFLLAVWSLEMNLGKGRSV